MNYPSTHKTLLERVQNGDEVSWNEFYCRYAPVIRFVGSLYHFSDSDCEDLVQLVMKRFFENSKRYVYGETKTKFRTYFASIVRSQAVDLIRANVKQRNLHGEVPEWTEPFEEAFLNEWRQAVLEEAKDELRLRVDPVTYQAFELYALQNRSPAHVASVLEMKVEQLYVAKSRCMAILKEIVARQNRMDGALELHV